MVEFVLGILGGAVGVALLIGGYALAWPDKAEKIAGWIAGLVSLVWRKADRTSVAWKVQGAVNDARGRFLRDAPDDLIEKKLKVEWADAEQAEALIREGEVVVFLQRSRHQEENLAHAVMTYLPKALLPRARRYLDRERMRATDLTVAKQLLSDEQLPVGALPVFLDKHLDPARAESAGLRDMLVELDEIEVMGWLSRILLQEYRVLGDQLHPMEPNVTFERDAEEFARWLARLAARKPGDDCSLSYVGRYFRVAIIFVGIRDRLATEGLRPYRRRIKRYLYQEKFDAIYLMARDESIGSVESLVDELESDGRVASASTYVFSLSEAFRRRKINRQKAVIACLRRRQGPNETLPAPDPADETADEMPPEERYEPILDDAQPETEDPAATEPQPAAFAGLLEQGAAAAGDGARARGA